MLESDLARRPGKAATAGIAITAVAVMAGAAAAERSQLAGSFAVLSHLHWSWLSVGIVLELASMAAFARMFHRLLAAGRVRPGRVSVLATIYAANAMSVSVPLAGPGLATAYIFRRFTRLGASALLAAWSLLAGGVISTAAWILVLAGAGLASGHTLALAITIPGVVLVIAALAMIVVAARRPRLHDALERHGTRALRHGARLLRRPAASPGLNVGAWAERLGALRLPPSSWAMATGSALVNWLTDAGVLAVSVLAVGAAVPWRDLLLVYAAGIGARSLSITPGGLAITEGALSVSLVASGLHVSQAVAAAVLYRVVSFWLIAMVGWLVLFTLRARKPAPEAPSVSARLTEPPASPPATPGDHELMLLHGQPGWAADWQAVLARLPAQLHAVAIDRPGYGASRSPAGGFTANARAVLDDMDARGVRTAVLVGHSWGGGVALRAASLAPDRVEAVVLLAGVGPGCVSGLDRLLAAPVIGPLSALVAWRWTPWIARARLAWLRRRNGRPLYPGEHVNLQVWGQPDGEGEPVWRAFLTEQRALLRELAELEAALPSIEVPVLLLADPADWIVPIETAHWLASDLPDAQLCLVTDAGHHLPRRVPGVVAEAIAGFLAAIDDNQTVDDLSCSG